MTEETINVIFSKNQNLRYMTKFSIYDNELTADLLDRCDGPVHLDVIACRVSAAVRDGKYSLEEIEAASVEALNILKAHDGYISSNEFGR